MHSLQTTFPFTPCGAHLDYFTWFWSKSWIFSLKWAADMGALYAVQSIAHYRRGIKNRDALAGGDSLGECMDCRVLGTLTLLDST